MVGMADRKVLVVDDEPDTLEALRIYLERTFPGLQVTTATNSEQALRQLAEGAVDLVLSDYRMPGRNGLDLLCDVALRQPKAARLLFTAYPDLPMALAAVNDARVSRFLVKPIEPQALGSAVAELLSFPIPATAGTIPEAA